MESSREARRFFLATTGWVTLFPLASGARSAENLFDNARLGHTFSLASGARSAEKILFLQPSVAPSAENFLATPVWVTLFLWHLARAARRNFLTTPDWVTGFLLHLARAQRAENFVFATLLRPARRIFLQRQAGSPVSLVSGTRSAQKNLLLQPCCVQRGENFSQRQTWLPVFSNLWRAQRGENFLER